MTRRLSIWLAACIVCVAAGCGLCKLPPAKLLPADEFGGCLGGPGVPVHGWLCTDVADYDDDGDVDLRDWSIGLHE